MSNLKSKKNKSGQIEMFFHHIGFRLQISRTIVVYSLLICLSIYQLILNSLVSGIDRRQIQEVYIFYVAQAIAYGLVILCSTMVIGYVILKQSPEPQFPVISPVVILMHLSTFLICIIAQISDLRDFNTNPVVYNTLTVSNLILAAVLCGLLIWGMIACVQYCIGCVGRVRGTEEAGEQTPLV